MTALDLDLPQVCGRLLVGGFDGAEPPARYLAALSAGLRGGAILFRRNLPTVEAGARLCSALVDAAGPARPPLLGVDQEGGRVSRLPAPFLVLPPMRALGDAGDLELVRRAAAAVGRELAAIGFNLDFAPVLDVDSNPDNPIIGDRAFGRDPALVGRFGAAFVSGLQGAGVMACGKHFPGHGDTSTDSHLDLPRLPHDRARLDAVELPPFRAAIDAGIATLMTAHVVCEGVDPGVPATLSRTIVTELLRGELGFEGLLFSDDLEMKAVAATMEVERSAIDAVRAGCDVLLVCADEDLQDRAHEALVREAERDPAFAARCRQAAERSFAVARRFPSRPLGVGAELAAAVGGPESAAVSRDIARVLAATRTAS